MDHRQALAIGALLSFPGMDCVITQEIGRGSNAIVYKAWYSDALDASLHHHVLVKELFPYHDKGDIYREADGRICCREDGRETLAMHTQSFVWGNDIHLRLREKYPAATGGNINTFTLNDTYYTILDFSGGSSLDKDLDSPRKALTLRELTERMLGVLAGLDVFHELGYLHLDVSPDNILLIRQGEQERVELIDYNSVIRLQDILTGAPLRLSMKPGFASPEVRMNAVANIGPWTDLYAVAAVFYRCLMGQPLTRMQQTGVAPIDLAGSPYLTNAPETVKSLLRQIMTRGLASVAKRRYRSVAEMTTDLRELLDRIDGVGVTHWALWEMSRKGITREIKANPALQYVTDDKALYPIHLSAPEESGLQALLHGGASAVLTGSGGMGKTTLLLHTAYQETRRYRRDRAVVMHLSLYGYQEGDGYFIRDSILRRLQFHKDVTSYADARHELEHLLQKPLRTKAGPQPVLCLLLDGYNEAIGDTRALRQEIEALAQMEGVRLLITARTALPEFPFETWSMQPLPLDTVGDILRENGLLMPESREMQRLLTNAMMLSLFVRACKDGEEQLNIRTREELIQAYLRVLKEKELRGLPDTDPRRWQVEAALSCVYPLLADAEANRRRPTAQTMLGPVIALYGCLGKGAFARRYPAWTGHLADIRGGAKDGDAWCGVIVHDLLWRQLGLLCQDENGVYRLVHQEFRDALAGQGKPIRMMLAWRKRRQYLGAMAAALLLALGAWGTVALLADEPLPAYDAEIALNPTLDITESAYLQLNSQYDTMQALLQSDSPDFDAARMTLEMQSETYVEFILNVDVAAGETIQDRAQAYTEALHATGQRFPWNEQAFDGARFAELLALLPAHTETYLGYIDRLETVHAVSPEDYAAYCALIGDLIDADAKVAAVYGEMMLHRSYDGLYEWSLTPEGEPYRYAADLYHTNGMFYQALEDFRDPAWDAEDFSAGDLQKALDHANNALYGVRARYAEDRIYERARRKQ